MKTINRIMKYSLAALLMLALFSGCEESADLSTDPLDLESPFTFEPDHGYPGTEVVIRGSGLSDVDKVSFSNTEADIISQNDDELTVEVPVGAISGEIKLVKNGRIISGRPDFTVDDTPRPTINGFEPAIAGSGDEIVISGSFLDEIISAYIGDLEAEIIEQSEGDITIVAPEGLQTGKIKLMYEYMTDYGIEQEGSTTSEEELSLRLPQIESIEPGINNIDVGQELTLTGSMFDKVTKVEFDDVEATEYTVSEDGTEMTVVVPEGVTSGTIKLTVPDGTMESAEDFSILLPTISRFVPEKGEDKESDRYFTVLGEDLDIVESVMLGEYEGTIDSQSEDILTFFVPGAATGTISLHSPNGVVTSSQSFAVVGDFWVNDWDSQFDIDRFEEFSNNNLGSFDSQVVDDGTGDNYAQISMSGGIHNNSFYMWAPGSDSDDKFSLYVASPEGVYIEFDMKVSSIDDAILQDDGTFQFKLFLMDSKGWGAEGEYAYGYNGPTSYVEADGNWHHFRMDLSEFRASDNTGLYNVLQLEEADEEGAYKPDAFCHPNSLRIATFIFGAANESGEGNAEIGLDNIKFVIE